MTKTRLQTAIDCLARFKAESERPGGVSDLGFLLTRDEAIALLVCEAVPPGRTVMRRCPHPEDCDLDEEEEQHGETKPELPNACWHGLEIDDVLDCIAECQTMPGYNHGDELEGGDNDFQVW